MPSPVNAVTYLASPAGSLAGSPQTFAGMARARSLAGSRTASSSASRGALGDADGFVHARMDEATQATALLAIEIISQVRTEPGRAHGWDGSSSLGCRPGGQVGSPLAAVWLGQFGRRRHPGAAGLHFPVRVAQRREYGRPGHRRHGLRERNAGPQLHPARRGRLSGADLSVRASEEGSPRDPPAPAAS